MNLNSWAIIVLCSHLCVSESIRPYKPTEWTKLSEKLVGLSIEPYKLLSFTDSDLRLVLGFSPDEIQRFNLLIDRSDRIALEIERYADMSIGIMTRADIYFPDILKQKLGKSCPTMLYYTGNPIITGNKCVSVVGSRNISVDDELFTGKIVRKSCLEGFTIVSGGARGVDSVARTASIDNGGTCIEYIADSIVKKLGKLSIVKAILSNQLLVLSAAKPDAGFTAGMAMMRNKLIYAQSDYTVVVKSDYNKGGTWTGAIDNLKNKKSVTFCWNNPQYRGNMELISKGAIPIDADFDLNLADYSIHDGSETASEQLNLFST